MCYRVCQRFVAPALADAADLEPAAGALQALPPRQHLNGFDHPLLPTVLDAQPRLLQAARWGLVPPWASSGQAAQLAARTLNARNDTVFHKPSFRESILQRRAVVWADGFYEWQHSPGGLKVPYFFQRPGALPFALGAVWSPWQGEATLSLLTVPGNALVNRIHNARERMPLVLPASLWPLWLHPGHSPQALAHLMQPCPDDYLEAWPLNPKHFAATGNPAAPEALAPWQPPGPQPSLFG
jgi:putative SOS response-associated peptidase YedK